ncbi:MAG: RtcB family protein [Myxococcales bacterium]|nr:RtcB family protein [Myxococcales bacterium]
MTAVATEHRWLATPLPAEVEVSLARLRRADDVRHVAVMPDVHLGTGVCVGTVVATWRMIYPGAVGGDLGCGMAALRFRRADGEPALPSGALDQRAAGAILRGLYREVPATKHAGPAAIDRLPAGLRDPPLSARALETARRRDGVVQFGTLGAGNHFIELQLDLAGDLWLMLHSGSRGMGQAILRHHLAVLDAGAGPGLAAVDADSDAGRAYLADLAWALTYAEGNRAAMIARASDVVAAALGCEPDAASYVACHHNDIAREHHHGHACWVHRKGAIAAHAGTAGLIPGSMGSASFHVVGRGHPDALCSSSHGAGRTMSRTEARRRVSARGLEAELRGTWFDVRLAERLRDEAPSAYKDITAVMRAQRDLTRIVRRLRPLLSYKGG